MLRFKGRDARRPRVAATQSGRFDTRAQLLERLESRVLFDVSADILSGSSGSDNLIDQLLPSAPAQVAQPSSSTFSGGPVTNAIAPVRTAAARTPTRVATNTISVAGVANTAGAASPGRPVTRDAIRPGSDFRYVLAPGTGFTAASVPDPAIQNIETFLPGYDAKAIARWDVVPYQTFDSTFNVGVVAFHMNGIKEVDFSVNGGAWVPVQNMTLNPQTNVNEYTATLRASDFADGQLEVRAIAYPANGVPRVLQGATIGLANGESSMFLSADVYHTLPSLARYVSPTGNDANDGLTPQTPMLTPNGAAISLKTAQGGNAGGGTVYLLPGTYTIASGTSSAIANGRWLTVMPAPGVNKTEVTVAGTSGSGFNASLIRYYNLRITGSLKTSGAGIRYDYCWIDHCVLQGSDPNSFSSSAGPSGTSWKAYFATDCEAYDLNGAMQGYALIRNAYMDRIGGDAFSNSALVINSSVHHFNQAPGSHTDLWQWTSQANNALLYGVDDRDGIGFVNATLLPDAGCQDLAMVECNASVGSGYYAVQLEKTLRNMFVLNTNFYGGTRLESDLSATNVVFDGCTFGSPIPATPGVVVR